jgi:hypothetical protein
LVQPLDTPRPFGVINPFTHINNIAITMKMFVLLPRSTSTSYIPNYLNMLLMILIITVNILIQTRKMPIMLLGLKFNAFEFQKKIKFVLWFANHDLIPIITLLHHHRMTNSNLYHHTISKPNYKLFWPYKT